MKDYFVFPNRGMRETRDGLRECIQCIECTAFLYWTTSTTRWPRKVCNDCKRLRDAETRAMRRAAGVLTKALRAAVVERDGMVCQHCGCDVHETRDGSASRADFLSFDHLLPVSRGGLTTVENLIVACLSCNISRGNRDIPFDSRYLELRAARTSA